MENLHIMCIWKKIKKLLDSVICLIDRINIQEYQNAKIRIKLSNLIKLKTHKLHS